MADYTLYFAPTPNGNKITLCLEDMNLNYDIKSVRITKQENHTEEFKKLNPNLKIPVLVDHTENDLAIFESGAILEYLAEKTGSFMPKDVKERYAVKQWLYFQMASLGPMMGQMGYFHKFASEDVPHAKERYLKESLRLFGVLDQQLAKFKYVAGDDYSIADMSCYFWTLSPPFYGLEDQFDKFENIKRWQKDIGSRPSMEKVIEYKDKYQF